MTRSSCSAETLVGATMCPACGFETAMASVESPESWPDAPRALFTAGPPFTAELLAFTGESSTDGGQSPAPSYCRREWRPVLEGRSGFAGFNGAALLVAPAWCAYRKLYGWLVRLILAEIVLSFVLILTAAAGIAELGSSTSNGIAYLSTPIVRISFSLAANRGYLRFAARAIDASRSRKSRIELGLGRLRKMGGTRETAAWIAIVMNFLISFLSRAASLPGLE